MKLKDYVIATIVTLLAAFAVLGTTQLIATNDTLSSIVWPSSGEGMMPPTTSSESLTSGTSEAQNKHPLLLRAIRKPLRQRHLKLLRVPRQVKRVRARDKKAVISTFPRVLFKPFGTSPSSRFVS